MNKMIMFLVAVTLGLFAPAITYVFGMTAPSPAVKTVPMKTDADIARAVKSAFAADRFTATASAGVSVQVENGVATLVGMVNTEREKSDLAAKARSVGGVKQVINDIQIKNSTPSPAPIAPKTR